MEKLYVLTIFFGKVKIKCDINRPLIKINRHFAANRSSFETNLEVVQVPGIYFRLNTFSGRSKNFIRYFYSFIFFLLRVRTAIYKKKSSNFLTSGQFAEKSRLERIYAFGIRIWKNTIFVSTQKWNTCVCEGKGGWGFTVFTLSPDFYLTNLSGQREGWYENNFKKGQKLIRNLDFDRGIEAARLLLGICAFISIIFSRMCGLKGWR